MREALVFLVVVGLIFAGLRNSKIALMGYIWFAIMRPDLLAWAGDRPFSLLLGIVAVVSCLRDVPYALPALRSRWLILLTMLFGWITLSVLLSPVLEVSWASFRMFLPTLLTSLLIPVVIREFEDLKKLFMVMAIALGAVGFKFGLWGVLKGGVSIIHGPGGMMSDNNAFALAMALGMPLCWYARYLCKDSRFRLMFLGFAGAMVPAVVMSHSRGGVLTLAAVLMLLGWYSKKRMLAFALLAAFSVPSVYLVRQSIVERLSTLQNVEEDNSAQGRLLNWRCAYDMSKDYPLFGVGFGHMPYIIMSEKYIGNLAGFVVHNNYLQMLADSGYPALMMLLLLLFGQILYLRGRGAVFRRLGDNETYSMAMGMAIALAGFAVGSTFLTRTHYETYYYMAAFVAAFELVSADRLRQLREAADRPPEQATVPGLAAPPPLKPLPPLKPEPEPARFKLGGRVRQPAPGPVAYGPGRPPRPSPAG